MTLKLTGASRDALLLSGATALSGLASYVFVAIGTRAVGAVAFAPVSVLWTLWTVSAATFTFPVQQWVIRTTQVSGEPVMWATLRRVWRYALLSSLATGIVSLALGERIFSLAATSFAVMAGLLPVASVLMGVNRGVLAARGRYGQTAAAVLGENLVRLGLVAAAGGVWGPEGLGWILMAGFGIALLFPGSFRATSHDPSMGDRIGLLGGFAGANAAAQTVLTAAPVLLSLLGGTDRAVTEMFAVLAILRAPYLLTLGVAARVTGPLTQLAQRPDRRAIRTLQKRLGMLALLGVVVAVPVSLVLPAVTSLAFGLSLELSPTVLGLLTFGSIVGLVSLLQMLVLLADGQARVLATAWGAAMVVGAGSLLLASDDVLRVSTAFVLAELVAYGLMVAGFVRRENGHRTLVTRG